METIIIGFIIIAAGISFSKDNFINYFIISEYFED